MTRFLVVTLLFLLAFGPRNGYCANAREQWEDISYGIDETDLRTVSADPDNPSILYAGSAKSIFKSPDGGKAWQKLYLIRGALTAVNVIAVYPGNQDTAYAGTQNGLYKTSDAGITWNRLFEGTGAQEKEIRHMAIEAQDQSRIYLGTANGLFLTNDGGKIWNKSTGEISNRAINFITINPIDPNTVYAAAQTGLFKTKDHGLTWDRIFITEGQTEKTETEEINEGINNEESEISLNRIPNCIAIDNQEPGKIYLGTNSGVFVSYNAGVVFDKISNTGLANKNIISLIALKNGALYAATANGIFRISKPYNRWEEIFMGLSSKDSRWLVYDQKNSFILAATKKGVYKLWLDTYPDGDRAANLSGKDPDMQKILAKFKSEPTIQEIQQTAIRYAEVNKEKIDEWRKSAKQKALLPTLSVGTGRDLTDYYHWDSGPNPDVLQKGKDSIDWSVTASWNLGELIWNDDQTNIDVRSKLMVQLRDDILNEVTRLYFERRRLQIELLTNPAKSLQVRLEKELRLQELTAGIDALTGGWFSKRLREYI